MPKLKIMLNLKREKLYYKNYPYKIYYKNKNKSAVKDNKSNLL